MDSTRASGPERETVPENYRELVPGDAPTSASSNNTIQLPSVTLPKGGGAIRGIGEKYSVAAATGSLSMTIPLPISPGRNGFQPSLQLSYSSGGGNGAFGLGWSLSQPSITRKTDKGVPRYNDNGLDADSDVFLLGGEDLVPIFAQDSNGNPLFDASGSPVAADDTRDGYVVRRYALRVEASFIRIEQWTEQADRGNIYWKTITGENMTSIYGPDENSRIFCQNASRRPKIFSWLVSETYGSDGNAAIFDYKQEDSTSVSLDAAHEQSRNDEVRSRNRYLKAVSYGNTAPNRDLNSWAPISAWSLPRSTWKFTLLFDYGEHDLDQPTMAETGKWYCRMDPFSSYRAGFEVRTYRLCQRILMFHDFSELGTTNCLTKSTDLSYTQSHVTSLLSKATLVGYIFDPIETKYARKSFPPLDMSYTSFPTDEEMAQISLGDVDPNSVENLPQGVDGSAYQWLDLDGEGLPGIFVEQEQGWYYKRNATSMERNGGIPSFESMLEISKKPNLHLLNGECQFIDLTGDGHLNLVDIDVNSWRYSERTDESDWTEFRQIASTPLVDIKDPNVKLIDLTGDGLADILVSEDDAFMVYPSLGVSGFDFPIQEFKGVNENKGPRLIFADPEESIYFADISGDGLTDIIRIRNSDICYWPNFGWGRFGAKVVMDNAPLFDSQDLFDHRNVRLADFDGSGAADILYFGSAGLSIYINRSGNGFANGKILQNFPPPENLASIATVDLMGNGTSCIVWSRTLPSLLPLKYFDITSGVKPYLLNKTVNNIGVESHFHYRPSTSFYQNDRLEGRPWITRLAFPVQCVEKVQTFDHVSKNTFVQRYAYHHGYFDGYEREFRGFSMVEQWDTDQFDSMQTSGASNINAGWHLPPVYTKTWFHTGVYIGGDKISRYLAHEYFSAPNPSDDQQMDKFLAILLDDTVLPNENLNVNQVVEACRALRGSVLRKEVYALDDTDKSSIPYLVSEQNHTIVGVQYTADAHGHSVFKVDARESLSYHYERNPDDARIIHSLVLRTDLYGNVLKSIKIAYGRAAGRGSGIGQSDQEQSLVTYDERDVTNLILDKDNYQLPRPAEARTYELYGFQNPRYRLAEFSSNNFAQLLGLTEIPFENWAGTRGQQKRLLNRERILYRSDDLSKLLPIGRLESMGLPGETYDLSLTSGILLDTFQKSNTNLLVNNFQVLAGQGGGDGGYVDLDNDGNFWIPSGRAYFSPTLESPSQELLEARNHFYHVRRLVNPFNQTSTVAYDDYDLLPTTAYDALLNKQSCTNDYRTLQPNRVTDINGNRSECRFDELGYVTGTAIMGKETESLGDNLLGFQTIATQADIAHFLADPLGPMATKLLGNASNRVVYDQWRFHDEQTPIFNVVITRETHVSDTTGTLKFQVGFTYIDGYGREIQKKIQAEPGDVRGQSVTQRWLASGWQVFNNKGNPIKSFEPFFDNTQNYTADARAGVSATLIYDPLSRPVAKFYPNHSWSKSVYQPWELRSFDVNDTVLLDPRTDNDIGGYVSLLPAEEYIPTWYNSRINGGMGADEKVAAQKTTQHANTPSIIQADSLGRTIVNISDNGTAGKCMYFTKLDIQGNAREMYDPLNRKIEQNYYSVTGMLLRKDSMEAGVKWKLSDIVQRTIVSWDSRDQEIHTTYDELRRPKEVSLSVSGNPFVKVSQYVYGESQSLGVAKNQRGKLAQHMDQAGTVKYEKYDFKGNLVRTNRQFAKEYKITLNWGLDVPLEDEIHPYTIIYDALNRKIQETAPEGSTIAYIYNNGGLLYEVRANVKGESTNGQLNWTNYATNITYNARRQRESITYGNEVQTSFIYDPNSLRVTDVTSRRTSDILQALHYTYDPSGNITRMIDTAQQTIFFRNQIVDPSSDYTYDPTYQLLQVTGREHLAQTGSNPWDAFDAARTNLDSPSDGNAMGRYTETYSYDPAGCMLSMKHDGSDSSHPGWTRIFSYQEPSQLEPSKFSNRLSTSRVGQSAELFGYSGLAGKHGNMTNMPHLSLIQWDYKDQLQAVSQQAGAGIITWYVYDNNGNRVRKITEDAGRKTKDRLYLGLCEIGRKYAGDGSLKLERQTLHVMEDKQRILLIETRTAGDEPNVPARRYRYELHNLIGSVAIELNEDALVVSYEEYSPFGSTSYQAVKTEYNAKRYRYLGKERDKESGLYYQGARYYAPWLARFISTDPSGISSDGNLYRYGHNNPVVLKDVTGHADSAAAALLSRIYDAAKATIPKGLTGAKLGNAGHAATTIPSLVTDATKAGSGFEAFAGRVYTSVAIDKTTLEVIAIGENQITRGAYNLDAIIMPAGSPPLKVGVKLSPGSGTKVDFGSVEAVADFKFTGKHTIQEIHAKFGIEGRGYTIRDNGAFEKIAKGAPKSGENGGAKPAENTPPAAAEPAAPATTPTEPAAALPKAAEVAPAAPNAGEGVQVPKSGTGEALEDGARAASRGLEGAEMGVGKQILKRAGPVAIAVGFYFSIQRVAHAAPEKKHEVAMEEAGGQAGGFLGGSAGSFLLGGALVIGAAAFELTPAGWVTTGVAIVGGIGGGVGGSVLGEKAASWLHSLF